MSNTRKDLRVQRTKEAIKNAFNDLICETDYSQISVTKLAERARINRKTFYLHYSSLEELLSELQNEMVQDIISRFSNMEFPRDFSVAVRELFVVHETQGKLEKCVAKSSGHGESFNPIIEIIIKSSCKNTQWNSYKQKCIFTYLYHSTVTLYRLWLADGKQVPMDKVVDIAVKLICKGVDSIY